MLILEEVKLVILYIKYTIYYMWFKDIQHIGMLRTYTYVCIIKLI